jgi:hypothetical protein
VPIGGGPRTRTGTIRVLERIRNRAYDIELMMKNIKPDCFQPHRTLFRGAMTGDMLFLATGARGCAPGPVTA